MDAIAGAASVSQLVAYSFSSIRYLQQLYTELKTGNSVYRNEEKNISLLLDVIKRLSSQNVPDSDPILPILIDISGLACEILHLLRPKRLLGYNWTSFTTQDKINLAFESLDKKRKLLHLYISQANNEALVALRETVEKQNANHSSRLSTETMSSRATITSEGNVVGGYRETGTGFEPGVQPNVTDRNNNVPLGGVYLSGTREGNTQETRLAMFNAQIGLAQQRPNPANPPVQPTPNASAEQAESAQPQTCASSSQTSRPYVTPCQSIEQNATEQATESSSRMHRQTASEVESGYGTSSQHSDTEQEQSTGYSEAASGPPFKKEGVRRHRNGRTGTHEGEIVRTRSGRRR